MKAKELRIGNYLLINAYPCEIEHGIGKGGIFQNPVIDGVDISKFSPIPLTEEWLLKLGFEKIGVNYRIGNFNIYTKRSTNDFVFRDTIKTFEIIHVHQLQNLYFALTQTELTLS